MFHAGPASETPANVFVMILLILGSWGFEEVVVFSFWGLWGFDEGVVEGPGCSDVWGLGGGLLTCNSGYAVFVVECMCVTIRLLLVHTTPVPMFLCDSVRECGAGGGRV